jgi:hypothetical protein
MKITKWLILPSALLFMLACARGQDIHYNYDRGANFQSYRTYQWVDLRRGSGGRQRPTSRPVCQTCRSTYHL